MKIGLEAKVLTPRAGGIGRYAANLIAALLSAAPAREHDLEFVLFTGPQTCRRLLMELPARYSECFCTVQSSLLRALFALPVSLKRQHIKVFHGLDHVGIPLFGKHGRYVVTVHDVLPLMFPQMFTRKHRFVVRAALPRVVKQADAIIVPSHAVKRDVLHYLQVDESRIVVIPEGCDARFHPASTAERLRQVRHKYGLPEVYILCVGTLQPRKNVPTLLKAFAHLQQMMPRDPDVRLVIAGARGWYEAEIFQTVRDLALEQVVLFPGFIAEEDLPDLYRGARLFVFPSLSEGFGLPLLEAMGCGVPVLASNVSAIPEVAGDAALLVDPRDVEAMAAAMGDLLHNDRLRAHLRRQGLQRVQQFSWAKAAERTLDLYLALGL